MSHGTTSAKRCGEPSSRSEHPVAVPSTHDGTSERIRSGDREAEIETSNAAEVARYDPDRRRDVGGQRRRAGRQQRGERDEGPAAGDAVGDAGADTGK